MDRENGYRQWIVPAPRAVFLLVHGLGANTERWVGLAEFCMSRGFSSYAVELNGFDNYAQKILDLRERIILDNPAAKIFLVGESLGGLVSLGLALRFPDMFTGLICMSPAFANKIRLSPLDHVKIFFALFYNRQKRFAVPFNSAMCTRDTEYRMKMDADKRETRTGSAMLLAHILFSQIGVRLGSSSLKVPVLFQVAGDDKIINTAVTRTIFNGLSVQDKTLIEYPGMYHSLSIDLGKKEVFNDIAAWAEKRIVLKGDRA